MIVKESIEFKRGISSKELLDLGWESKTKKFLKLIANDYQFNSAENDYFLGYFNIGEWTIDPNTVSIYRYFVDNWKDYVSYMDDLGIYVEHTPSYEETVFIQKENHKWYPPQKRIHEELVHKFHGRWQKSGDEIGIYKNPASIKRMGKWNRALSDKSGNIWVTDVPDTTHSEIFDILYEIKEIDVKHYHDEDDDILEICGWQRYSNSKNFYLAESFSLEDVLDLGDQFQKFGEVAKAKNPQYNFNWDMIITDAYQ